MPDDRDALDERLLDEGGHAELLAAYYPVILARLLLRLEAGEAFEVAHRAVDRLLGELARGRRYPVPYRVVVHQVTGWTLKEYFAEGKRTALAPLPPDWDPGDAGHDEGVASDEWVRFIIGQLSGRDGEVAWLRYVDELEIPRIAERLGMTRNAVDQSLHRSRRRLRKLMDR